MYGTCVIMGQSNDYKLYVVTWSLIMHVCEASSNNFKGGQAGTHACMMHGTLFTCLCLPVVQSRPASNPCAPSSFSLGNDSTRHPCRDPAIRPTTKKNARLEMRARAHTHSRLKKKKKKEIHAYYFKEK